MANENILLIADSSDELDNIQHLLTPEFGSLLQTDNEAVGVQLFNTHQPRLLILAFGMVQKAEQFYLSLYENDDDTPVAPHKTLLLCKGKESEQAFELCKKGVLDDYVADRPLFDLYRLRLSVNQALKSHQHEQNAFWLSQRIERLNRGVHQFNEFVNAKLATGDNQQRDTVESFKLFSEKLSEDLKQLESNLVPLYKTKNINKNGVKPVDEQFSQIRDQSISTGSQHLVDNLDQTESWLQELNEGYKTYLDAIQTESEDKNITRIMLVDDDDLYRDMVISMLDDENLRVSSFSDGKAALTSIQTTKPDVILLDYMMPGFDGIAVLKQIKANPVTQSIPVIMLTGDKSREIVAECIREGAAQYIIKPSDRNTILSKVEAILE